MKKVDNVSKPIESKRSGNHIINNCRYSIAKLFKDIVWSIEGKWKRKEKDESVRIACEGKKSVM